MISFHLFCSEPYTGSHSVQSWFVSILNRQITFFAIVLFLIWTNDDLCCWCELDLTWILMYKVWKWFCRVMTSGVRKIIHLTAVSHFRFTDLFNRDLVKQHPLLWFFVQSNPKKALSTSKMTPDPVSPDHSSKQASFLTHYSHPGLSKLLPFSGQQSNVPFETRLPEKHVLELVLDTLQRYVCHTKTSS